MQLIIFGALLLTSPSVFVSSCPPVGNAEQSDAITKTGAIIFGAAANCVVKLDVPEPIVEDIKKFVYENRAPFQEYLLCTEKLLNITDEAGGFSVAKAARVLQFDFEYEDVLGIFQKCNDDTVLKYPRDIDRVVPRHDCLLSSKVGESFRTALRSVLGEDDEMEQPEEVGAVTKSAVVEEVDDDWD